MKEQVKALSAIRHIILVALACASFTLAQAQTGPAANSSVDPASYPALDEKQIGHLRHMMKLSRQLPGEWAEMGSNWWNTLERSLQYQLAFMSYATALAQYNYTPAYREPYREMLDAFMQKLLLPDVWQSWSQTSRGSKLLNPDLEKLGEGWIDPVKKDNIMYSAHVFQIAALYEMLYRAHKYDQPGSITFDHQSGSWGFGPEKFEYDLHKLAKLMYNQFKDSNYIGIACEPNAIFPECNQHPILAFMHYDFLYGTSYAQDVKENFKRQWLKLKYTDPETKSHMLMRYRAQGTNAYVQEAWADGWTGTFMHGWDKEFIESLYPTQRDRHLQRLMYQAPQKGETGIDFKSLMTQWEKRIGFGMFAILASEIGDTESRDTLLAYADENFAPIWRDGQYLYPRNDDMSRDANGIIHTVDPLAGNALLPFARINVKDGVWKMYNEPWSKEHFGEPYISEIDFEAVSVSQAWYDSSRRALVVTIRPGPLGLKRTSFKVHQLNPSSVCDVVRDDQLIGRFRGGEQSADGAIQREDSGDMLITTTIDEVHSFVISLPPSNEGALHQ